MIELGQICPDHILVFIISFRYYYNHNTKVSTWVRPPALRHVIFANPKETEIIDRNDNFEDSYEEEDSVEGWLDGLSSTVLNFIPNPWSTDTQLVS